MLPLYLRFAVGKLRSWKFPPDPPRWPVISVVVPMRNEETCASGIIQMLEGQDYPGEWEILAVNDRSTDATPEILNALGEKSPRLKVLHIQTDAPICVSPKKRALAMGFAQAKGEVLMTTDADCRPGSSWMRSMAAHFRPGTGIVQGPKHVEGGRSLLHRYQKLETFSFVSIEAAGFAAGKPMLASAPSLAYRRHIYEDVGGFAGLEDRVSGDDDMLVHRLSRHPDAGSAYNIDPAASVGTGAVDSWKSLLSQRARWASNGMHYEDKGYVALLICVYLFYLWVAFGGLVAALTKLPWWSWILPLGLKMLLGRWFLGRSAQFLGRRELLVDYWWCELLHIFIVVFAVPVGHLGLYRWKK